MRRVHAILVIVALMATPLALLARSGTDKTSECDRFCCLPHGHHAGQSQYSPQSGAAESMLCHHGDGGHQLFCTMRSNRHAVDFGFNSPVVPAIPLAHVAIVAPTASRQIFAAKFELPVSGYLPPPFEPPRL